MVAGVVVHRHRLRHGRVVAHEGADELALHAVLPDGAGLGAPLVVQEDDAHPAGHGPPVPEGAALVGEAAAVHPGPLAVRPAVAVGHRVVQLPQARPLGVGPLHPGAVGGVVPVLAPGQGPPGGEPGERSAELGAVTDALAGEAGPGVVREPRRPVALAELLQHLGEVLAVVGTADAGGVERSIEVPGAVGPPRGVHRKPVRVLEVEALAGAGGVHPRHHHDPVLAGRRGHLAEQVAVAQVRRAPVEAESAGVVGHDAAGVDDDALHAGALPVLHPPPRIVAPGGGVDLPDVGLAPAHDAPVPGLRPRAGGRRSLLLVLLVEARLVVARVVVLAVMWGCRLRSA